MCINNQNRLLDIRLENDLTQIQIAKIFDISRQNYSFWETSAKFIPLRQLNKYCHKFNVSMDYVFKLTNKKSYGFNYSTDLNKKVIGNNLKKILKYKKITQKQLADMLNTSQSTISAYINGKTLILTAFVYQIAKKYNVSIDKICGKK